MPRAKTRPDLPDLLTIAEASQISRVSKPTIVRAYRAGHIEYFKTPAGGAVRIYALSLSEWINTNSYGGAREHDKNYRHETAKNGGAKPDKVSSPVRK